MALFIWAIVGMYIIKMVKNIENPYLFVRFAVKSLRRFCIQSNQVIQVLVDVKGFKGLPN